MSDYPMNVTLTFPKICAECGKGFNVGEEMVCVVRAGSAWDPANVTSDGKQYAVLEDGAELYRTMSYHADCAPTEDVT